MATYSYTCKQCNITVDTTRSIDDTETNPLCNICILPMTRVYSWGNTTFNGKGFYTTDKDS